MADDRPPFALTMPSDARLLPLARQFVEAVCLRHGFERAPCDAVLLAVHEALQNVIRHAHRDRPEAPVEIQCAVNGESIEVRLLDDGDPFDVTTVPHLDPGELRLGGRGVFLIRRLMDEVRSEPRPVRGNVLLLVKCRGAAAPDRRRLA